jgi:tetratricopeptide (TPR) repeat protein
MITLGQFNGRTGPDQRRALVLFQQAERLWKKELFQEAEKLYFKANVIAPSSAYMNQFATNKIEMSDIKGANKVWDETIKSMSGIDYGRDLLYVYHRKITENLLKGSTKVAIESSIKLLNFPPEGQENMFNFFQVASMEKPFTTIAEMAFLMEDKNSLLALRDLLNKFKNTNQVSFYVNVYLKMLDGKYDEAINYVLNIEEKGTDFKYSKTLAKFLLPIIYSYKGDVENSRKWIQEGKKDIFLSENWYSILNGRNSLTQKKYSEAIEFFTTSLKTRQFLFIKGSQKPGKFINYTLRAQAYEGLKEYINAKKDYQAALVYEPDYEPALAGLARLEGHVISEIRKDKTPPEILILEPNLVSRGLKITASGTNYMVKGFAKDSFGIKSVTINGNAVYSKEDGNFWGNVSLAKGVNKITVIATDLAGNPTNKEFEIEQIINATVLNDIEPIQAKEGKNIAVFIASQNYDDQTIPSLDNPISDAVKLKLILKNEYNFKDENIFSLFNPEVSSFKQQFQLLSESIQPEDNLIIFYAGHGIWNEKEKKGYWLLTDAKRNESNTWLPNKEVLTIISNLSSRHTLLITDACFSGSVFKTRSIGADAPPVVREMSEKISRIAITSGNDTEVPDESIFMKYLIKALNNNKEKYLTAQKMFINQILEAVMTESKTEPRYGTLELAGHVGGDFIFTKK